MCVFFSVCVYERCRETGEPEGTERREDTQRKSIEWEVFFGLGKRVETGGNGWKREETGGNGRKREEE